MLLNKKQTSKEPYNPFEEWYRDTRHKSVISSNDRKIRQLTMLLQEKDKTVSELLKTIEDLNQRLLHNRGKRFSRISEQAALLNNRNVDGRASEKDDFDGKKLNDDAEKHPGINHIGCWVHARRNFVDALESDRKNCMDVIETIAELFDVEYTCKLANMSALERKQERLRLSVPILTRLYAMVETMSKDLVLMSNTMMAKAINYILNQWQSLRNFILNGKVEISNNLVEQRMKTIKLAMKNSQNIGSEEAAERHAFMHSMFESCHLNRIRPMDYFSDLFLCYRTLDDVGKVAMLPCYYTNKN